MDSTMREREFGSLKERLVELLTSPSMSLLVGQLSDTFHDLPKLPTQAAASRHPASGVWLLGCGRKQLNKESQNHRLIE